MKEVACVKSLCALQTLQITVMPSLVVQWSLCPSACVPVLESTSSTAAPKAVPTRQRQKPGMQTPASAREQEHREVEAASMFSLSAAWLGNIPIVKRFDKGQASRQQLGERGGSQ